MLLNSPSSQSLEDKLYAVKYFISGQGLSLVVLKATTSELAGPKKKHLNYLVGMTNAANVSIPNLVKYLMRRSKHLDWQVVFKSAITTHYLMNYGNERLIQNLASSLVNIRSVDRLANFNDTRSAQAYDMSTYLRRYVRYLSARLTSYRTLGLDFCRLQSASDLAGVKVKCLTADQLINYLSELQIQMDALLAFDVTASELSNGVISSAFNLLYKDFTKLYIIYQTAIIRLLELYFKITQVKRLQELLDAYKKFLVRMDKVGDLMRVVEQIGMDKSDLPNLGRWPESLAPSLLEHWLNQMQRGQTSATKLRLSPGRRSLVSGIEPVPRLDNPYASLSSLRRRSTRRPKANAPVLKEVDDKERDKEQRDIGKVMPNLIELSDPNEVPPADWVRVDL